MDASIGQRAGRWAGCRAIEGQKRPQLAHDAACHPIESIGASQPCRGKRRQPCRGVFYLWLIGTLVSGGCCAEWLRPHHQYHRAATRHEPGRGTALPSVVAAFNLSNSVLNRKVGEIELCPIIHPCLLTPTAYRSVQATSQMTAGTRYSFRGGSRPTSLGVLPLPRR